MAERISTTPGYVGALVSGHIGPRHDDGSPAPEDTIAKCKRILAAVDAYHDNPTQGTRSDLRHVIWAELERAAAGVPASAEGSER